MPEPEDDPSIQNQDILWRRIYPGWIKWAGENESVSRPARVAFQDDIDRQVSVSVARETTKYRLLRCYPEHSLAAITAEVARRFGCSVARRPTTDDPAHAIIFPSPKKVNARNIAKEATWVVLIDPRRLSDRLVTLIRKVWKAFTIATGSRCPSKGEDVL